MRRTVSWIGCPKVDNDRKLVSVCGCKYRLYFRYLCWVKHIDAAISDVELDPFEDGILSAAFDLIEGIVAYGIETEECRKAIRMLRRLLRDPIILSLNFRI